MMRCVRCSKELIAPERSEYWSDGHACHVWHCPKCSACFGSLVLFPTETESMKDIVTGETIFPSLFPALPVGTPRTRDRNQDLSS